MSDQAKMERLVEIFGREIGEVATAGDIEVVMIIRNSSGLIGVSTNVPDDRVASLCRSVLRRATAN